jgi:iron(III) transport system ATP-binding protein
MNSPAASSSAWRWPARWRRQPRLLLLDEPFSNLDVDLRERLAHEVRAILKAAQATALFVTHDQLEAFAIGDAIGVMHDGQLHQWDDAYTLYHRPATRFVATSSATACSRRPPCAR